MKLELLKNTIQQQGFNVELIEFYEEGYEVHINLGGEKCFQKEAEQTIEEQTGLLFAEIEYIGSNAKVKLAPVSFEEMVDYVWSYIEKFCVPNRSIQNKLLAAFSALERVVEEIPEDCAHKNVALDNYTYFSKIVF